MSGIRQAGRPLCSHRATLFLAAILGLTLTLVLASRADARVYWTNSSPTNTIGRAALNGLGVDQSFIIGTNYPTGVTVDGAYVYWTNNGYQNNSARTIGRANLDGSGVDQSFIPDTGVNSRPVDVEVDGAHIYWSNAQAGTIGRANLDGSGVEQDFISASGFNTAGVEVDGAHVYWTRLGTLIGRANVDGSSVEQDFITGANSPWGIAVDDTHVYWANTVGDTIGRANLDGSGVEQSFITSADLTIGVAVDALPDVPPNTSIDSGPAEGSSISNNTPTFTFSSNEESASFECSIATGAPSFGACSDEGSHTPEEPLAEGSYTFYVRAVDTEEREDPTPATRGFVVDLTAPAAPTIGATEPPSPANDNEPRVLGAAEAASTVRVYESSDCSGPLAAEGSAAGFEAPGLTVTVGGDQTTQLSATATDAAENTSPCSVPFSYTEDSTAPAAPTIGATEPPSPANDNEPRVLGAAEAASTVRVYESSDCSGPLAAEGSAAGFEAPGLTVTVGGDQTTQLSATATDAAENTSPCSVPFSYTEDSTAPDTQIDSGPSGLTNEDTPTFGFSSELGASFECQLDGGGYSPCASPFGTSPLPDGPHSFEVRATDEVANTDPSPATRSFTVDTQPPQVKLSRRGKPEAGKPIAIEVSCSEDCLIVVTGKILVWGGAKGSAAARAARRQKAGFGLRKATRQLSAGQGATLKLRPKSKQAKRRLRRLVRRGAKARAGIRASYRDPVGNTRAERLTIRLRRSK